MDLGLKGKTAIVCASSKGLGKGCAEALAQAGCNLVMNGRRADILSATASEIRTEYGVTVTEIVGDVSDAAIQKDLLAAAPTVDILVNNNGGPPRRDYRELDRAAIMQGLTQNLVTPFELIQAVLPGMAERGFGRVVNITSMSVYIPLEGLDLSSAARAGLTSFLAGITRTVADKNVTINNMLPGKFDTDRLKTPGFASLTDDERKARLSADVPAKRLGTPGEFGQVCAFLCSVHAGYMTGQNFFMDGGTYLSAF
jgi:3-oxoacyl-[acyl-carrier protein] reductase